MATSRVEQRIDADHNSRLSTGVHAFAHTRCRPCAVAARREMKRKMSVFVSYIKTTTRVLLCQPKEANVDNSTRTGGRVSGTEWHIVTRDTTRALPRANRRGRTRLCLRDEPIELFAFLLLLLLLLLVLLC